MFNYTLDYSAQLEGKEILLKLLPLGQSLTMFFSEGSVHCSIGKSAKKPDLCISFTPGALLAMAFKQDKTGLKLEGDAVLGQALEQSFHDASMNWEEFLQRLLGESFSYPVIVILRRIHQKISQIRQQKKNQIADYLQEETDCLPLVSEVQDFCEAVDELKLRVDRLEALAPTRSYRTSLDHNPPNLEWF